MLEFLSRIEGRKDKRVFSFTRPTVRFATGSNSASLDLTAGCHSTAHRCTHRTPGGKHMQRLARVRFGRVAAAVAAGAIVVSAFAVPADAVTATTCSTATITTKGTGTLKGCTNAKGTGGSAKLVVNTKKSPYTGTFTWNKT